MIYVIFLISFLYFSDFWRTPALSKMNNLVNTSLIKNLIQSQCFTLFDTILFNLIYLWCNKLMDRIKKKNFLIIFRLSPHGQKSVPNFLLIFRLPPRGQEPVPDPFILQKSRQIFDFQQNIIYFQMESIFSPIRLYILDTKCCKEMKIL